MESWAQPYLPPTKFRLPPLELRDSYSGKLVQIRDGGVYVCGITPYDATHLGHAATYLSFDLISRFLIAAGRKVNRSQNVTDIDDPLLERATRDSVKWQELAESQVQLYRDDMTALRVLPPDHFLSVIENMELIISYIEKLILTGNLLDRWRRIFGYLTGGRSLGKSSAFSRRSKSSISRTGRRS